MRPTAPDYRLLGVGVSALASADEADPADLVDGRAALAEHAVDSVRARFGDDAVVRGLAFEGREDSSLIALTGTASASLISSELSFPLTTKSL